VSKWARKSFAKIFGVLLLGPLLQSCSTQSFLTEGAYPLFISSSNKSDKIFEKIVTSDFYFWGHSPEIAQFNLDDFVQEFGMLRPSYVTIETHLSFKNLLYTFMTLGFYCPQDFKILFRAKKESVN